MACILIADAHDVVRSGLRRIIQGCADWSVVAEAADGKDAIAQAIATKPDVAILDYTLPLLDGVEATRQIRRRVPSVEVLIFTMHYEENLLRDLLNAGARGYLLKSDAGEHLIAAIQALVAHKSYFTDRVSELLIETFLTKVHRIKQALTNREQNVVQLIAEGHSNKQIALILNISTKTVETHRASLMRNHLASTAAMPERTRPPSQVIVLSAQHVGVAALSTALSADRGVCRQLLRRVPWQRGKTTQSSARHVHRERDGHEDCAVRSSATSYQS